MRAIISRFSGNKNSKAGKPRVVVMFTMIIPVLVFLFSAANLYAGDLHNTAASAFITPASELTYDEMAAPQPLAIASNSLLSFSIPQNEFVRLSVFNTSGREITVLINDYKKAGDFSADLNKAKLTKGTYYYRLVVGKYKEIRRLDIIK